MSATRSEKRSLIDDTVPRKSEINEPIPIADRIMYLFLGFCGVGMIHAAITFINNYVQNQK